MYDLIQPHDTRRAMLLRFFFDIVSPGSDPSGGDFPQCHDDIFIFR
jgi:hypothetical protein